MSKFCRNCGAPLREDAAFCTNCGTPAEQPAQSVSVPPTTMPTAQIEAPWQAQNVSAAQQVAVPGAATAKPRSKKRLLWLIPVLLVLMAAVAAGGWFLFTPKASDYYLSKTSSTYIDWDGDRSNSVTEYREDGQILRTDFDGTETVYEYDADGKVIHISSHADSDSFSVPVSYSQTDGNYYGRAVIEDEAYVKFVYDQDMHLLSKEVGSEDREHFILEEYEYYANGTKKSCKTTNNMNGDESVVLYDKNGYTFSNKTYHDGMLTLSEEYENGKYKTIYRATSWSDDGVIEYVQEEYDDGLLYRAETYDENDELTESTVLESQENGCLRYTSTDAGGNLVRTQIQYLDENGFLARVENFDENGTLSIYSEFSNDEFGHQLSAQFYYADGELYATQENVWSKKS